MARDAGPTGQGDCKFSDVHNWSGTIVFSVIVIKTVSVMVLNLIEIDNAQPGEAQRVSQNFVKEFV